MEKNADTFLGVFMKNALVIIWALVLTSCMAVDRVSEDASVNSDDLEFVVDSLEGPKSGSEFSVEAQNIPANEVADVFADHSSIKMTEGPAAEVAESEEIIVEKDIQEPKFEEFKNPEVVLAEMSNEERAGHGLAHPKNIVKRQEIYHVQAGDTLMLIAHKIYGDYRKWKELRDINKVKGQGQLSRNMPIKYVMPSTNLDWKPEGLAHLVKGGETLGTISKDKYGTVKKWKFIYDNNRPLIRDPNLIFAGFTIYYKPARDLASKPR
jgi:nucleoid-associated protein YgaU